MLILAPFGYVSLLVVEAFGLWLRQTLCFHRYTFERLVPSLGSSPLVQLRCAKCRAIEQSREVTR